jgi:hypothetical protein
MFIVRWDGDPPQDRQEWVQIVREVLLGASGSYTIRFYPSEAGWKFELDWREDLGTVDQDMVANTPGSVKFNLHETLKQKGKPVAPDWKD